MILRTGIDLIEIERVGEAVERHSGRLLKRVFTEKEIADCYGNVPSLAVRFAAKEAVSKALGTGFGEIGWQEVEIQRGNQGEPILILHGRAEKLANKIGLTTWSVSLSHTNTMAVATVTAVGFD
jgi:holo-[acyl-carrier protein] synthase